MLIYVLYIGVIYICVRKKYGFFFFKCVKTTFFHFLIGQIFTTFQWDLLLLEVGFLAIFFQSNFNDDYEDEINVFSYFTFCSLNFFS